MTATLASTARSSARTTVRTDAGVRTPARTSPVARPARSGPGLPAGPVRAVGRTAGVSSCHVISPASRWGVLVLKLKVTAVAVVALVGVGVSAAELSTWTQPDPAVDYVAGDPAWAHVTGR